MKEYKIKETIVKALPQMVEKIDYTKITCPVSKFEKPSACPIPPVAKNIPDDTPISKVISIYPELPKPPCGPVVLCHCPPPPKLHPGDCPCASPKPDTQSAIPSEPCRTKFKYSCPEKRIFYCPPRRIILKKAIKNEPNKTVERP
ncbi:hypothetical protein PV327_005697 [Microctonus hyperodae]|uniref:Uncharacterized protein n=1 Tax=Microctonus hyperodae TaxID=165561 RepID=A0AA39L006_MICHY|nr:hypothetical protein PV327_005697 [Microctonus hyperodae]